MIYDEATASDYALLRTVHPGLLEALTSGSRVHAKSRALELGCGTGNYISALQLRTGCSAWGADPSADMLAKARLPETNVTWICAPAENIGLPQGQFDFVFCVDTVHHFRDRERVFHETARQLAPGGTLCIATDSEDIIRNRLPLSTYWPETVDLELARYPQIETLERELRNNGFTALRRQEVRTVSQLRSLAPYRAKVFSCLRLLSEDAYQRGLEHLEKALARGPIATISRYLLLWARQRNAKTRGSGTV